jgi:hypothetical protein
MQQDRQRTHACCSSIWKLHVVLVSSSGWELYLTQLHALLNKKQLNPTELRTLKLVVETQALPRAWLYREPGAWQRRSLPRAKTSSRQRAFADGQTLGKEGL